MMIMADFHRIFTQTTVIIIMHFCVQLPWNFWLYSQMRGNPSKIFLKSCLLSIFPPIQLPTFFFTIFVVQTSAKQLTHQFSASFWFPLFHHGRSIPIPQPFTAGFLLVIFAGAACLVLSVLADPRGLVRFLPEEQRDFLFNGAWDVGTIWWLGRWDERRQRFRE